MARINVEQQALTDPRFQHLGELLRSPKFIAHATGLGFMTVIWNYLTENWSPELGESGYCVDVSTVSRLFKGRLSGRLMVEMMLDAKLASVSNVGSDFVRIRGTYGRIEWLWRARERARTNGKAHTAEPTLVNPPALAPALAPAPAEKTNPSRVPRAALPPGFARFWDAYPARNGIKRGKAAALKHWTALKCEDRADAIIGRLQNQILHKRQCEDAKVFVAEFPDPERWIKHKRYNDEVRPLEVHRG